MADHDPEPALVRDVSFATALAATVAVAVLPAAAVTRAFSSEDPNILLVSAAALVATGAAVIAASWVWARRPASRLFSFGDLMLWNWLRRRRAEATLQRSTRKLGFTRDGAYLGEAEAPPDKRLSLLGDISLALDSKTSYTYKHTDRVERIARRIAVELGLDQADVDRVGIAAVLHDIGNIRIPEGVLRKPGALQPSERDLVESHALLGAVMAFEAVDRPVADGILHHHERWDGEGYPNGLAGERIPLIARVVAAAEAFDAMTSTRSYRDTVPPREALRVLAADSGRQFDPRVVAALARAIPRALIWFERLRLPPSIHARTWEALLSVKRAGTVALLVATTAAVIALVVGPTAAG